MYKISVLIASWNTKDITEQCLTHLYSFLSKYSLEIIVVDNASSDHSSEMIQEKYPLVRLIQNKENMGYAPAVNQAFRESNGELILLLGSDVLIEEKTFATLIDFLDGNQIYGGVTPKLLNPPDNRLQKSLHRFPTLLDGILTYLSLGRFCGSYHYADYDYSYDLDVDQPDATAVLFKRNLFEKDGFIFDESFKILYTDVELFKRIRDQDQKIRFLANYVVLHYGSLSCKRATPVVRLQMYRDIDRYYKREFGKASVLLHVILFFRLAAAANFKTALQFLFHS